MPARKSLHLLLDLNHLAATPAYPMNISCFQDAQSSVSGGWVLVFQLLGCLNPTATLLSS